ncbi:MAG: tatB [Acidimicrobiales bacterium]|nr:tatB [Acidimicrobiales bacterium]
MFNVGGPEVLVILLVALVVLGPQQLPKAVRSFGTMMAELRKISGGFQAELQNALEEPTPARPTPIGNATTMEQADVTETVVRSAAEPPAVAAVPDEEPPSSATATAAADTPPRHIDPVDRAAG